MSDTVLKASNSSVQKKPGFASYVPLKSGWNAGFFVGTEATGEPLKPEDPVKWFYQK
jgi:hypothetical protein